MCCSRPGTHEGRPTSRGAVPQRTDDQGDLLGGQTSLTFNRFGVVGAGSVYDSSSSSHGGDMPVMTVGSLPDSHRRRSSCADGGLWADGSAPWPAFEQCREDRSILAGAGASGHPAAVVAAYHGDQRIFDERLRSVGPASRAVYVRALHPIPGRKGTAASPGRGGWSCGCQGHQVVARSSRMINARARSRYRARLGNARLRRLPGDRRARRP